MNITRALENYFAWNDLDQSSISRDLSRFTNLNYSDYKSNMRFSVELSGKSADYIQGKSVLDINVNIETLMSTNGSGSGGRIQVQLDSVIGKSEEDVAKLIYDAIHKQDLKALQNSTRTAYKYHVDSLSETLTFRDLSKVQKDNLFDAEKKMLLNRARRTLTEKMSEEPNFEIINEGELEVARDGEWQVNFACRVNDERWVDFNVRVDNDSAEIVYPQAYSNWTNASMTLKVWRRSQAEKVD